MKTDIVHQNLAESGLEALKDKTARAGREKELKEACRGFEAIFLSHIMTSMRNTLPGDGLFKETNAMNIYKSMHDQYLAEQLSKSRYAIGIKEMLFEKLKSSV